jgi:hypothetical protein
MKTARHGPIFGEIRFRPSMEGVFSRVRRVARGFVE